MIVTFLTILTPLVISGMGFLAYRHPELARKIFSPLRYVTIALAFLCFIFFQTRSNAYYKCQKEIYKSDNRDPLKYINLDSLKEAGLPSDTFISILKKYETETKKHLEHTEIINQNNTTILSRIEKIQKEENDLQDTILGVLIIAFLVLLGLEGLTLLFDRLPQKDRT